MGLADAMHSLVGDGAVLTDSEALAPYLAEWRGHYRGRASIAVLPRTLEQVAAVVRYCHQHDIGIVPQGGNTGLCGGAVAGEHELLLSLARMNQVREVDAASFAITAEAGCTLAAVQAAAADKGRLFPLSLSAEGSCQIGGNLSTNAGGVNVLRYGGARDLTLGLEVVLPDGRVFSSLDALRKNTAGYDLKQLFIGAEGTLGVITAATLKLFAQPGGRATAWVALDSAADAVALFGAARDALGEGLTAFELIPDIALDMILAHVPGCRAPLDRRYGVAVLLELSGAEQAPVAASLERFLTARHESGEVRDAAIAANNAQAAAFWRLRHSISDAQRQQGVSLKHDIALPVGRLADFMRAAERALRDALPDVRIVSFGHVGDGNLHYNLSQPAAMPAEAFRAQAERLTGIVHAACLDHGGTISAEHGVGQLKRDALRRQVGPVAHDLMRSIKSALDPKGLMNPGKVL
jgi:FAD/FMN-containing dehydrogenase